MIERDVRRLIGNVETIASNLTMYAQRISRRVELSEGRVEDFQEDIRDARDALSTIDSQLTKARFTTEYKERTP